MLCQIATVFICGTSSSYADCVWQNSQSTENYTFNIPGLTVPRNAATGTVIYASPVQAAIPSSTLFANCTGNTPANRSINGGALVLGNSYTYATNVPGIGIRFFDIYKASKRYWGEGNQESYDGGWGWDGTTLGIEVVVTGPVSSGTINGALIGTFRLGSLTIANLHVTTAAVVPSTCRVDATQTVNLAQVRPNDLPSVGSVAGNAQFNIKLLNCPAGMNSITYQLDAPSGIINATSGTFSATADSTARGIGFIVKDVSNAPFSLGNAHPLSAYNKATGGDYPIQLAVQYYRTGALSAGTVKGILTYTLSYQ